MKPRKLILKVYPQRSWEVAELYEDDKLIVSVNLFYTVDAEWFCVYETVGGIGYGWSKGQLKQKIYIGDAEFKEEIMTQGTPHVFSEKWHWGVTKEYTEKDLDGLGDWIKRNYSLNVIDAIENWKKLRQK